MKKIIAIFTVLIFVIGSVGIASAEVIMPIEFDITTDGEITAYYGESDVEIREEIHGIKVKKIGDKAFFDLGISSVTIYEGAEEIGVSAFEGCNAVSAVFPATMKKIGDSAFENCDMLKEVVFESTDIELGNEVFYGTGPLDVYIYCTEDEEKIAEMMKVAKGDENFCFKKMHTSLAESINKDILGVNMMCCADCGYEGSAYLSGKTVPFEDVSKDAWFYPYVEFSYDFGIVKGKTENEFCPDDYLTCAEAAKIVATIHAFQTSGDEIKPNGEKWYDAYVDYCYEHGIIEKTIEFDWEEPAKRGEVAYLFSRCDVYTNIINEVPITDIPDVNSKTPFVMEILDLYNKGIAVGDENMNFKPDEIIKRSEGVTLITKTLCWELRTELPKG